MTYSSYELKYCERCGGLGLRRSKSGQPYCMECDQIMRHFSSESEAGGPMSGQLRRIVFRMGARLMRQPSSATTTPEAVYAS